MRSLNSKYLTQKEAYPKQLASAIGMSLKQLIEINELDEKVKVPIKTTIFVPATISFKSELLIPLL